MISSFLRGVLKLYNYDPIKAPAYIFWSVALIGCPALGAGLALLLLSIGFK